MKTLFITLGLAAVVFGHSALAAKDAYLESLIRKTIEAKRAQPQMPELQRVAMFKFHPLAPAK